MSRPYLLTDEEIKWAYDQYAFYNLDEIADALFVHKCTLQKAFMRKGYHKKPIRKPLVYDGGKRND